TENQVAGYETIINGYKITNKYIPEIPEVPEDKNKEKDTPKKGKLSKTGINTDADLFGILALLSSLLVALKLKKRN
ncbi:hypothetical protein HZY83_00125, partial [Gemella sp. GH3]|nr:hypothetical protein [Gemella sp. GH3.1]NYS50068.1 hypothetical protein [Gemella sp. GH3]